MGYSYGYGPAGRLVLACDECGEATGNTRKVPCPHGYCQAAALCSRCRKAPEVRAKLAAYHEEHCRKAAAAWAAHKAQEAAMLAAGHALRWSALGVEDDTVHVLFRDQAGRVTGYYMASATYGAIPLVTNATPDDYRKHGELLTAPADFQYRSAA